MKEEKIQKCLTIKYICYFVFGTLILILFWYYLSSFGAVYQNTQIYLIKNTLISISFSCFYPFLINLIPSTLRIIALKNNSKKENNDCIYKISKIFQII